jgi:hypothetical protein
MESNHDDDVKVEFWFKVSLAEREPLIVSNSFYIPRLFRDKTNACPMIGDFKNIYQALIYNPCVTGTTFFISDNLTLDRKKRDPQEVKENQKENLSKIPPELMPWTGIDLLEKDKDKAA